MSPMPGSERCALRATGILLALCLSHPAAAQNFVVSYNNGVRAFERGDYSAVEVEMQKALAREPASAARRRMAGTIPEAYLPHHYYGLAAARRGDCGLARRLFADASNQTAIAGTPRATEQQQALAACIASVQPPAPSPTPAPAPSPAPATPTATAPAPATPTPAAPAPTTPAFDDSALAAARQRVQALRTNLHEQSARRGERLLVGHADQADWQRRQVAIERRLARVEAALSEALRESRPLPAAAAAELAAAGDETRVLAGLVEAEWRRVRAAETERLVRADRDQARETLDRQVAQAEARLAELRRQAGSASPVLSVADNAVDGARRLLQRSDATAADLLRSAANLDKALQAAASEVQRLAGAAEDLARQNAENRALAEALARDAQAPLAAPDEAVRVRAQGAARLAAQPAPDASAAKAIARELAEARTALDQARARQDALARGREALRPLLAAYLSGDHAGVLALPLPANDLPAETRAHAHLLRAAALYLGEGESARARIQAEIGNAAKLRGERFKLPARAFPPAFRELLAAQGIR